MAAHTISVSTEADLAKAVASVAPPEGVRLRRIYFDTDHMGDPAVRIIFSTSKKIDPTRERIRKIVSFKMAVWEAVSRLGIEAFPYIDFVDAR